MFANAVLPLAVRSVNVSCDTENELTAIVLELSEPTTMLLDVRLGTVSNRLAESKVRVSDPAIFPELLKIT